MFGIDLPFWLLGLLSGLRSAAGAVWTFCTTKPGCYVAAAAIVVVAIWGSGELGYRRGDHHGMATCEAAHALATTREVDRQHRAGESAVHAAEARAIQSTRKNIANKEIVAHVKAQADAVPPPPAECPLAVPAGFADQLRQLE